MIGIEEVNHDIKRIQATIKSLKALRRPFEMELPVAPFKWRTVRVSPAEAKDAVAKCMTVRKQILEKHPFLGSK